ncbi:hypothetical protein BH23CHL7_BH23CHL7_17330 [soil metagenome]
MAITKVPARDFTIEIKTAEPSTFTPIGGLNSLSHSPSSNTADTTDFDSAGRAEHLVMERGDSWTIAGRHLEDASAGTRDAGQAAVEALAKEVGLASLGTFQITSPGGNKVTFEASAEVTLAGGGHNDPASWQGVLTISGEISYS